MDLVRDSAFGRAYKARALALLELRPGLSVLDVGCGPGDDLIAMAECVGPTGRALGIDRHELMIDEAKRRAAEQGSAAEFRVADVLTLDLAGATFDRVHADRVLQLLPRHRTESLAQIRRIMRSGAQLVVSNPDTRSWVLDIGVPRISEKILGASRGWGGGSLPNLLRDCGFADPVYAPCASLETDFAKVDAHTPLRDMAHRANQRGAIGDDELADWLACLDEAIARDRFALSTTMFVVRATKP